jgi:hypothetical protein
LGISDLFFKEVWMQTDAGPHRITYDAMAAEPVAVSPQGDRVVSDL